jgi:hypothetical protein
MIWDLLSLIFLRKFSLRIVFVFNKNDIRQGLNLPKAWQRKARPSTQLLVQTIGFSVLGAPK